MKRPTYRIVDVLQARVLREGLKSLRAARRAALFGSAKGSGWGQLVAVQNERSGQEWVLEVGRHAHAGGLLYGHESMRVLALPELPEVGDTVDNYPALPQEARWLIGFWLNRGSAQPKKSRTAYSARTDKAQLNWGRRAKERIAAQLGGLDGWSITCGPYSRSPDAGADTTWFVDPPYGEKGKFYRVPFTAFATLGEWCRARRGQVIACENVGATWLPFEPLGSFKSSKGRSNEALFWRAA